MRECIPFIIGIRAHLDISQTVLYGDGRDMTLACDQALGIRYVALYRFGLLVDRVSKCFYLEGGVNTLSSRIVCILVEDHDDRALVGFNDCSCGYDRHVSHPVVIDSLYVYRLGGLVDDSRVVAAYSPIASAVKESARMLPLLVI